VAQECRVQGADEVGGADQEPAGLFAERRDDLEQLVGHALQRRRRVPGPLRGDFLHLVDEHHRVLQLGDFQEGFAQCAGQALGITGQPGGEHFHERPFEPGRDGLGEGGLARAGRAEQDDGARRHHAELVGEVSLGQG